MSLLDKLRELFDLDPAYPGWDFKLYIWYRLVKYESENSIFKSFDEYVDYCLEKMEVLYDET